MVLESDGVSETFSDIEEMILEKSGKTASTGAHKENNRPEMKPEDNAIDNFVIVNYSWQKYPGKTLSVTDSGLNVECMEKKRKCWHWPEKQDCLTYEWEDEIEKINPPKIASKRNQFFVPELDTYF